MRLDKGTLSNCASAAALLAGLSLPRGPVQGFVLAVGLFAFGGGITNSLAVKMLFDRIPFLIGSGVIPARFREIRTKIRQLIMTQFFAPRNLEEYFREHRTDFDPRRYLKGAEGRGLVSAFVEANWERIASPQVIEPIVDRQIQKLLDSPMGGVLIMVGVDNVKPTVTQFVAGLVAQMRTRVLDMAAGVGPDLTVEIDERKLSEDLCAHVENLLESKLRELDAQRVKRLLEEVIRRHLGWLVVWGNVCGGILGLLSRLAGWAP